MTATVEEGRREVEGARMVLEEERRRANGEIAVAEMKACKAAAQAERAQEANDRERKRLAEESALLAVRAGEGHWTGRRSTPAVLVYPTWLGT